MSAHRAASAALTVLALLGCQGSSPPPAPPPPGEPPVAFVTPAETTYTNGVVAVQVRAEGAAIVQLSADGTPIAALEPPFSFAWDTSRVAEGSHLLEARAVMRTDAGPSSIEAFPVIVVVDRTPPEVARRAPAPGATEVVAGTPFVVDFTEPVRVAGQGFAVLFGGALGPHGGGTFQPELSADGRRLVLRPMNLVRGDVTVEPAGLVDRAGNPVRWPAQPWAVGYGALGARGPSTSGLASAALAIDRAGRAHLAWFDLAAGPFVQELGPHAPAAEPGIQDVQALAFAADGTRYLLARGYATARRGTARWEFSTVELFRAAPGAAWSSLGAASGVARPAYTGLLSVGDDGTPVVANVGATALGSPDSDIRVTRWRNGAFEDVGAPVAARAGWSPSLLAFGGGSPEVVYSQYPVAGGAPEHHAALFDGMRFWLAPQPLPFVASAIFVDGLGVWIAGPGGSARGGQLAHVNLTGAASPIATYGPAEVVQALHRDAAGRLWIAARGADRIAVRRLEADGFVEVASGAASALARVVAMTVDREGTPWLLVQGDNITYTLLGPPPAAP
jgi:hypothetical protein